MERARAEGKSLGRRRRRRPVTDHPSWSRVVRAIEAGDLTRAEAAKKLHVRKATLIEALGSFPKGRASAVARTHFDQGS
jgi:DNA invertase Pin-like site-specific DNA recombinase